MGHIVFPDRRRSSTSRSAAHIVLTPSTHAAVCSEYGHEVYAYDIDERKLAAYRSAEAEKINQQITEARAKLARLTAEREGAVKAVVEGHERVSDTDAEMTRVRDDYARTQARLESFRDLDDRRAHFSLAVQEAFSANEAEEFHLIGTLADSIKVNAEWERAVEGALGSSLQSILYHNFLPPRVKQMEDLGSRAAETVDFGPIRHRAFRTSDAPLGTDPVSARIPLLANRDVILGVARPTKSMDYSLMSKADS